MKGFRARTLLNRSGKDGHQIEDENPVLVQYAKRIEQTKASLKDIHEKVSKKTQSTLPMIENGRKLARSLGTYGDLLLALKGEDPELGECLAKVAVLETLLNDLTTKLNNALMQKLEEPINEFIKGEVSAAEQEKKQYDKARQTFEAADAKLRQLKGREDAKAFEIEKERNVAQERYVEKREQTQAALVDAFEKNKFYTLDRLCDYIESYHTFFRTGLAALEQIQPKIDHYRQFAQQKKKEYRTARGQDVSLGDSKESALDDKAIKDTGEVVMQGWLRKTKDRKTSTWKKCWVVLKYKYLYHYASPEADLDGAIPLSHCCIDKSSRKEYCFAINGRLESHFFVAQSEGEQQQWMDAIRTCIESEESHETRESGKEEIKGNAWVGDEEDDEDDEAETKTPLERCVRQLLREEKRYTSCLANTVKMYMIPLLADPKLKLKVLPDEVAAIFADIKPLSQMHTELLKQLESASTGEIGAAFLKFKSQLEAIYPSYIGKISEGMSYLNIVKQRSKGVSTFLAEREQMLGEGNELATLLALPIVRISQYIDFFERYIQAGACDKDAASVVVEALRSLSARLSQTSGSSKNLSAMLEIRRRLQNYEGSLIDTRRRFIREGVAQIQLPPPPATPQQRNDPSRPAKGETIATGHLFLFNDLLVMAKAPMRAKKPYKVVAQLEMQKAVLTDEPGLAIKLEEKMRGKHTAARAFGVQAISADDKTAWLKALRASLAEMEETRKTFGIPLAQLMGSSREQGRDVPQLIEKTTTWIIQNAIGQEGIFRKAGRLDTIEDYKDLFNKGKNVTFPVQEDPYVVAGVMAHFLMELPEALLTSAFYSEFVEGVKLADETERIARLKGIVHQLPLCNRFLLQHLVSFLQFVAGHEDQNKMGPANLAIVFGPTLLRAKQAEAMFDDFAATQKVVETMILNYHELFKETEEQRNLVKKKLKPLTCSDDDSSSTGSPVIPRNKPLPVPGGSSNASPMGPGSAITSRPVPPAVPVKRSGSAVVSNNTSTSDSPSPPASNARRLPTPASPLPPVPGASSSPYDQSGGDGDATGGEGRPLTVPHRRPPVRPERGGDSPHIGLVKPLPSPVPMSSSTPSSSSPLAHSAPDPLQVPGRVQRPVTLMPRKPLPNPVAAKPLPVPGSSSPSSSSSSVPTSAASSSSSSSTPSTSGSSSSSSSPSTSSSDISTSSSELLPPSELTMGTAKAQEGRVVKQGWLTKKGGQRRNWRTRWFVLKQNELAYYKEKKDAKPKGTIVLSGVTVKPSSHKEFCFAIATHERTYLMAGKDASEQEEWISAINSCL